ncbi:MAG: kynureninase [Thermoanaerobaculia bacterium]
MNGPLTVEALSRHPSPLAPDYSGFRVGERILLSGHSHQAWPDRGRQGQLQAWDDAARFVDDKWERAFERADRVREGYRRLLDDPDGWYSLAASTHDLLVKLLSALPLAARPRLVTTDEEFYSLRRQLLRLEEEGIEIVRVPSRPAASVGERLAAAVDESTAAVLTSTVFFHSARIAGDLTPAAEACRRRGAILVLDVYHQLNVVPFSLAQRDLLDAYVVSAGYKYCQLGEGNAILRYPRDCSLRPVATGWFAEFGDLTGATERHRVPYNTGHDRFAGATYDPTSHYRAAEVFDYFREKQLTPELLRALSQHQVGRLRRGVDALDLPPAVLDYERDLPLEAAAGFLAVRTPHAEAIHRGLKERRVFTDFRGEVLRLGPAPYVTDRQVDEAVGHLAEIARTLT